MSKITFLRSAFVSALMVAVQGTLVLADTTGSATTTPSTGAVSKTVSGKAYTLDSSAINRAQGSSGGAETLFSLNTVAGLVPGIVRFGVGSGPGYRGQGQLSMRGGAPDQIEYLIDGVPVNRGFDFYNGTTFSTNGVQNLQVSTGGAPAR